MEAAPQYFIDFAKQMNARFDGVEGQFVGMNEKLDLIASTVLSHSEILEHHDELLETIAATVAHHTDILDSRANHEERISRLERSVAQMRFSKS